MTDSIPPTSSGPPPVSPTPPPAQMPPPVEPLPTASAIPPAGVPGGAAQAGVRPPQAGIIAGVVLVVVGGVFLVARVADLTLGANAWPLWIVVPGLGLFVASFLVPPRGGLGLAIPGAIITIVGAILWFQETYGVYATWAYAWALVAPTGPGVAMLVYGLAKGDRALAADGLRMTLVGLGLFLGFALFFEGALGLSGGRIAGLQDVLPVIVIGLGVLLVALSLFGPRTREERR